MKAALLVFVLLFSGCVSAPTGQGSRLLPWNWFHSDANAGAAKADAAAQSARLAAVEAAHVETVKAGVALNYAPDSPPVEFARRTLGNGNGLLAQVAALSAERDAIARKIVVDLFTGTPTEAKAANAAQTASEKTGAKVSRNLTEADQDVASATAGLASANLANAGDAAKYRRLWFWIWVVVGGWLLLQLLSGIARFYPTFGPIARVAGFLSAPAVQASYERVTQGISSAIMAAEKVGSGVADSLRAHLDGPLDAAEKHIIRAKVDGAKKKADPV